MRNIVFLCLAFPLVRLTAASSVLARFRGYRGLDAVGEPTKHWHVKPPNTGYSKMLDKEPTSPTYDASSEFESKRLLGHIAQHSPEDSR